MKLSRYSPVDLKLFTTDSIAPYCSLYLSRNFSISLSNSTKSSLYSLNSWLSVFVLVDNDPEFESIELRYFVIVET